MPPASTTTTAPSRNCSWAATATMRRRAHPASSSTPSSSRAATSSSGDFYFDYENKNLQGDNIDDELRNQGSGQARRFCTIAIPMCQLGGPIKRDKLWFFASYRDQNTATTVLGFPVDNPSGFVFPTRLHERHLQDELSTVPEQPDRPLHPDGPQVPAAARRRQHDVPVAPFLQDSCRRPANLDWNSVVSPKFFYNARSSTFGYNWPNKPYGVNGELNENLTAGFEIRPHGNTRRWCRRPRSNNRLRHPVRLDRHVFKRQLGRRQSRAEVRDGQRARRRSSSRRGLCRPRPHSRSTAPAAPATSRRRIRVQICNTPQESEDYTWHHSAFFNDQFQQRPDHAERRAAVGLLLVLLPRSVEIPRARSANFFYAGAAVAERLSDPWRRHRTPAIGRFPAESGTRAVLGHRAARWHRVGPLR